MKDDKDELSWVMDDWNGLTWLYIAEPAVCQNVPRRLVVVVVVGAVAGGIGSVVGGAG